MIPFARRKRRNRDFRPRHPQAPPSPPPPPVGPPVLLNAEYAFGVSVTLQFDRPVSIAGFQGDSLVVNDVTETGRGYDGTGGASLLSPSVVEVSLVDLGEAEGSGVTLSAASGAGIVAVDGGAAWAGGFDLPLPYP